MTVWFLAGALLTLVNVALDSWIKEG